MAEVAIVGVGQSVFSRDCGVSIRELSFEAFKEAMEGLDITTGDIDASIICSAPEYDKQRSPAGLISEYLELTPKPSFYVETVCSSSSTGLRVAWSLVKAGLHKVVAVIGFQKMSELSSRDAGGYNLGIALRPDHARRLRHVCPGSHGQVRYYRGAFSQGAGQELALRGG